MPILSVFFGIVVRMWHDDHAPPHIHVKYQGFEALVHISDGTVHEGRLPRKATSIVKEWSIPGTPYLTLSLFLVFSFLRPLRKRQHCYALINGVKA